MTYAGSTATAIEPLITPDFAQAGLGDEFMVMVNLRMARAAEIARAEEEIAGLDAAILAQLGGRTSVRAGSVTVTQVPGGVTRRLDKAKLLKIVDAGTVAACYTESPRKWHVRYTDADKATQDRQDDEGA